MVCAVIVAAVYFIVQGVVEIVRDPPWLKLTVLIVICLLGPSGLLTVLVRSRQKYVEKTHKRVVDLERLVDPGRTSSRREPNKERQQEEERRA